MSDGEPRNGAIEWRLRTLETVQRAMQEDIYNERMARESAFRELRKELAETYMTRDQLKNQYVSKDSVVLAKRERREWPLVIAASLSGFVATIDLIVRLATH